MTSRFLYPLKLCASLDTKKKLRVKGILRMSSFSSASGNVSFHTDMPGVTMTRAPLHRAKQLDAKGESPGPAAYANAMAVSYKLNSTNQRSHEPDAVPTDS